MLDQYLNRIEWRYRKLDDYGSVTRKMMGVMLLLRDAGRDGNPWQPLHAVHGRTLNALIKRDWIVRSDGVDGVKYRVTHRGLREMRIWELPVETRNYDGICPRCNKNERHGSPVCTKCLAEMHPKSAKRQFSANPGKICVRCRKNPVHVTRGGYVKSYCKKCMAYVQRRYNNRRHARQLHRIEQGEHLPCPDCGNMRYYTQNRVYEYCYDCHRRRQTAYSRNRRGRNGGQKP